MKEKYFEINMVDKWKLVLKLSVNWNEGNCNDFCFCLQNDFGTYPLPAKEVRQYYDFILINFN